MTLVLADPTILSEIELVDQVNQEHDRCQQAYRSALEHAHRAGEFLLQLKAGRKHGEWLGWLNQHCKVPERTAQTYMRIAREWHKIQESATVADLSLRDAITLLSEPEDEIPVVEAELLPSPVKPSQCQFSQGDRVEVASESNLFHNQTVEVLEKRGDVYLCKTSNGTEYPFLPAELKPTGRVDECRSGKVEGNSATHQPINPSTHQPPSPTLTETEHLRSLLKQVYEVAAVYLPVELLSEIESTLFST